MNAAIEKKLVNGTVITIAAVVIIVVLSIWQYRRIQDTGVIIKHTNQVLYQTQEVLNGAVQYELNVKNFLLTGDSSFLDTAGDSAALMPAKIGQLRELIADDPIQQQQRVDSIAKYVFLNSQVLQHAILVSKTNNFAGAAELIIAGATTGYSHSIQSIISQLNIDERKLLDERRRTSQTKASELQVGLWALIAAVAVLAIITFRKVRVDLAKEKEAREQLSRFNQLLEEEVRVQSLSLEESEEKYKTLFYKSPLPKWIYDEESLRFLEVNDVAIRIYGYERDEFLNMTIAAIRPPEDLQRLLQDVQDVRSKPGAYRNSQWRHIKKTGEVVDVEITAHPIEYEGRHARMVIVNDVTDRKRYEMQLERLNLDLARRAGELSASNAELERFAYIASHDLQEPLRMVSSFLQLLQKKYGGQLDSKADQYIHYAVDGAERMKALIMDLLEYSRVGTGKESFGWVDTAGVMEQVGDIFREKIIAVRARINIDPLPQVWGDKVQLTQLFQNLVGNALKYHSEAQLVIDIRAIEQPDSWRFSVADNGIGIDPLFFEKIFIIFQRLHNKSDYSGTGIGLAICKKIVERHGGRIWVESGHQKGSTFFFTISKKS
jgi:PAS domain S-box-containing protein